MASLRRYEAVRPDGSAAAQTWFNVGDSDLATHLYRTTRLAEGATLTAVTGEIATAWGVDVALLPMCDEPVATQVCLEDGSWIGFQEYFVGRQHVDTVHDVRFVGEGLLTAEASRRARGRRCRRHRTEQPDPVDRPDQVARRRRRHAGATP
ncbi:MAG: 2-phospho-L-lactate transferase CofD family protein [Ilumatobacteraceae bacterium]